MRPSLSLFSPQDITTMRSLARLSQTELAEALGYDQRTISAWERGTRAMATVTYLPFLNVIMRRFALLGYLEEQKYQMVHLSVVKAWYPPLPSHITVL